MNKKRLLVFLVLITFMALPLVGCQQQETPNLVINEVMSSNGETLADLEGEYEDWLEIYNPSAEAVDLKGYYLADKEDNLTRWQFPESVTIEAGGFLLVYASGKDKMAEGDIHTNFSISIDGETLTLTRPDGKTIVDQVEAIAIPRDVSYGRYPDGSGEWHFYKDGRSTPGSANQEPLDNLEAPSFSQGGGFYTQEFSLVLTTEAEGEIYYTLDGSQPDPVQNPDQTFLYRSPIMIKDRTSAPNQLSTIPTIAQEIRHKWQAPQERVFKGTVVRAQTLGEELASKVVTNTYFVTPQGVARYSLPVLSLATNKDNLFDPEKGIYVGGKIFAEYLQENPDLEKIPALAPANYQQRGQAWERPATNEDSVSLAYINEDGQQVWAQNIGLRIHGGASRSEPQKSLRIYAREEYGKGGLEYPFFGDGVKNYQRLILRNSGNEWGKTMFLDGYLQSLVEDFHVDTQKFQPAILFINGEYWGIHNIRERQDEYYLEGRYGLDPKQVVILENNAVISEGNQGDERHYLDLLAFMEENNLQDPDNYAYVQTQMDIENFIDFQIINIFLANIDWPQNNVNFWRYKTAEYDPEGPPGQDGRWRWLLFDLDSMGGSYGAGYWDSGERFPDYQALERAADPKFYTAEGNWPTFLLSKLLENPEFQASFINRFLDHLNTSFKPEVTLRVLDDFAARTGPEIGEHLKRWGYPASYQDWQEKVEAIGSFMAKRPAYQEQHLLEYFDLQGTAQITLKTDPQKGIIKINTLEITEETQGIANPANWQGVYFQGVPVEITALPKPGYKFVGWEGDQNSREITLTLDLRGATELEAVFE